MSLTTEEQAAVDRLRTVTFPCSDPYCDRKCSECTEPLVVLGEALAAIDAVRNAKKLDRLARLEALIDDG